MMMIGLPVFLLLAAGLAIFASVYFARDARARRELERAPILAIAAVRPGTTARITGTVEYFDGELVAPLTGRTCAYYLVLIQEYRSNGKSGSWVEILREEQHLDFLVRDATGVAQIRMDSPHALVVHDHKTRSGTFDDATEIEAAFLRRFDKTSTNFLGLNRGLRYNEAVLEFGEKITVLGATRAGEGEVRFVIEAPPEGKLLLSDEPGTVVARRT